MNQPRYRLRTALAAATFLFCAASSARAQYVFEDGILPPRAVVYRLADRGFTGIARPRFDGRAYVVEAFDPAGLRMRLFVDAQDGAILGRRRIDAVLPSPARPTPGYGWTEEDETPNRHLRQAERLVPPADIPMPEGRGMPPRRLGEPGPFRMNGPIDPPARGGTDSNPLGLNPELRGRAEAPRRVARIADPSKASEPKASDRKASEAKAAVRAVPDAPKLRSVETAKPESRPAPPVAAVDPSKIVPQPGVTPAAVQSPVDGTTAKPAETARISAEAGAAVAKPAEPVWKDPPEGRRNVRVIGGATVVPGTADKTADKDAPAP